jgi:hypothetical protein
LGHSHSNEGFKIEIDNPEFGVDFLHHKDYKNDLTRNPKDIAVIKLSP